MPCSDPAQIAYWWNRPLIYSLHAMNRADERYLPRLHYLPPDAKLADMDVTDKGIESLLWKIAGPNGGFFVVLAPCGTVITTWGKDNAQVDWERHKNNRRISQGRATIGQECLGKSEREVLNQMYTSPNMGIKPSAVRKARRSESDTRRNNARNNNARKRTR